MKASRGNRWSSRTPMLLAAVAGLALTRGVSSTAPAALRATPTVTGTGTRSTCARRSPKISTACRTATVVPTAAYPDLSISWRIISNLDGLVVTCAEAGNANTVTAWIDGGGLTTLTAFDAPCPASASSGSFVAELPSSGTYNVSLELTAGATLVSETPILVQPVDCSGLSATPRADMFVNF